MKKLIFLAVFAVYVYTAYPTIAPRDSADLAAAVLTLSPAHPPGYPLYVLLGRLWLWLLPWGDPAYRLNLMSAAAGAGCVTVVFLIMEASCGAWAAAAAALALAFSLPLWKFSLLCEMYSLHGLFLAAMILLAPGVSRDEGSLPRRAALSAFLLGLALVNHQAFILAVPGLAVLWQGVLADQRHRRFFLRVCLPLFLLGLSVYAFLWLRAGPSRAWALLTRREYGTWQLSAGLSRPLSLDLAWGLLGSFWEQLWGALSPLALGLGALGCVELWRGRRRFCVGLAVLFAAFGPAFFVMTRFDLGGWVARTVLESALVAPAVIVCVAAGFGLAWVGRRWRRAAWLLAAAMAGHALWRGAGPCCHRDDVCAFDYVKDLRRALPPGSIAAAGGDTALYASRYLDLTRPDGRGRRLVDYQDIGPGRSPRFALGLSLQNLARLGLTPAAGLAPAGLVQTLEPGLAGGDFWELSVLRHGSALRREESYARDVLLSYAFAHYLAGTLLDFRHDPRASWDFLMAAALDPEDYHIEIGAGR